MRTPIVYILFCWEQEAFEWRVDSIHKLRQLPFWLVIMKEIELHFEVRGFGPWYWRTDLIVPCWSSSKALPNWLTNNENIRKVSLRAVWYRFHCTTETWINNTALTIITTKLGSCFILTLPSISQKYGKKLLLGFCEDISPIQKAHRNDMTYLWNMTLLNEVFCLSLFFFFFSLQIPTPYKKQQGKSAYWIIPTIKFRIVNYNK